MTFGAWAMLTISCVILYGGLLYYLAIAQNWDLAAWFNRFKLSFVVDIWQKGPEGRLIVVAGFIFILLIFEALIVGFGVEPAPPEPPPEGEWVPITDGLTRADYTAEGDATVADPELPDNIVSANLTLSWTDDDVSVPGPGIGPNLLTNEPDTFRLVVNLPDGDQLTGEGTNSPPGGDGTISISVPMPAEGNLTGWEIVVECLVAGDLVGPRGRVVAVDGGNSWALFIEYTYLEWVVPEE